MVNRSPLLSSSKKGNPSPSPSNVHSNASLSCIPHDPWQILLSFLTFHDLLTLTAVSTNLNKMTLQSHQLVICDPEHSSNENGISINNTIYEPTCQSLRTSFTSNPRHVDSVSSRTFSLLLQSTSAMNINEEEEEEEDMTREESLKCLLQRFPHLRHLIIYDCFSLEDSTLSILNHCYYATDEEDCHDEYNVSSSALSLQHLELRNVRMMQNHTPLQLTSLSSSNLQKQQNQYYQNNTLIHVHLAGSIYSSYETVLASFTTSPNLEYLHLDGCKNLTDANVYDLTSRLNTSNSIKLLQSRESKEQPEQQVRNNEGNTKLHTLILSNAPKLSNLSLYLPSATSLTTLNLSKCSRLRSIQFPPSPSPLYTTITTNIPSIGMPPPNLKELDLSFCSSFTDSSLSKTLSTCTQLERLNLKGCKMLKRVEIIGTNQLKELDLGLCTELEWVSLVCDSLGFLELGLCVKVNKLHLKTNTMKDLDLSMLSNLEHISIQSTSLQELNLSGCFQLKELTFLNCCNCPNLQTLDICGTKIEAKNVRGSGVFSEKISILETKNGESEDWNAHLDGLPGIRF